MLYTFLTWGRNQQKNRKTDKQTNRQNFSKMLYTFFNLGEGGVKKRPDLH